MKTINISIAEEDLNAIDGYCSAHNLTRSKFLVQNTLQFLQADNIANGTLQLVSMLNNFAMNGKLSDDEKDTLSRLETTIRGFGWQTK